MYVSTCVSMCVSICVSMCVSVCVSMYASTCNCNLTFMKCLLSKNSLSLWNYCWWTRLHLPFVKLWNEQSRSRSHISHETSFQLVGIGKTSELKCSSLHCTDSQEDSVILCEMLICHLLTLLLFSFSLSYDENCVWPSSSDPFLFWAFLDSLLARREQALQTYEKKQKYFAAKELSPKTRHPTPSNSTTTSSNRPYDKSSRTPRKKASISSSAAAAAEPSKG